MPSTRTTGWHRSARRTAPGRRPGAAPTSAPWGGVGEVLLPDPNTNLIFPKTAIPLAAYAIRKGKQTIRTQVDYFG